MRVGEERTDALLAGLAPLLADLLADLTDRQRSIARLMLVEGLRQSEVAERLGVSRATISVMAERARIRRIDELLGVLRRLVRDALAGAARGLAVTADPGLVLAWLVLAHLVADFVLQPGRMARAKAAPGSGVDARHSFRTHWSSGSASCRSASPSGCLAGGSWRSSRSATPSSTGSSRC